MLIFPVTLRKNDLESSGFCSTPFDLQVQGDVVRGLTMAEPALPATLSPNSETRLQAAPHAPTSYRIGSQVEEIDAVENVMNTI